MKAAKENLTGIGADSTNYPDGHGSTAFEAVLSEAAGAVTGTIIEECDHTGATIGATVDGRRVGSSVRFAKLYDDANEFRDSVAYDGVLDDEALEIHGRWTIPGDWSGTFFMTRNAGISTEDEQKVSETVR